MLRPVNSTSQLPDTENRVLESRPAPLRSRWRSRRLLILGAILVLALGLALSYVVLVVLQTRPCPSSLCVAALSASVEGDGHHVDVSLTIANPTNSSQAGQAFWLVSAAGNGPPWSRAIYQSAAEQIRIGPHQSSSLHWREDVLARTSFYDFSAWIHVRLPDGREIHSDGRATGPLYISLSGDGWNILRHGPSTGAVAVEQAVLYVSGGGRAPTAIKAKVLVRNYSQVTSAVSVRWAIVAPLSGREAEWWNEPLLVEGGPPPIAAHVEGSTQVSLDLPLPPNLSFPSDSSDLQFRLSVEGREVDRVLYRGQDQQIRPVSKLHRSFLPAGPTMITAIEAPGILPTGESAKVYIRLRNLTGVARLNRVWWILGAPNDDQPWQHTAVMPTPVEITLGPWQSQTVIVNQPVRVGVGEYALSSWFHTSSADAGFQHSDGLWLTDPTVVSN